MGFKEDLEKAVEKIEDEAVRAVVINEVEQAHTLDVGALKANKEEILKEKQELKTEFEAIKANLDGLGGKTLEDFEALEKNIEDLKAANPGDETVIKQLKAEAEIKMNQLKAEKEMLVSNKDMEIKEKEAKIESLNTEINSGLAERELVKALEIINVKPELKDVLTQALKNDVFVDVDSEGNRKVKLKFKNVPFDVLDGVEAWSGEATNKNFISAIRNAGAGANGSSGRGSGLDKPFSELTYEEEVKFFRRDPEGYKQAKANAGK